MLKESSPENNSASFHRCRRTVVSEFSAEIRLSNLVRKALKKLKFSSEAFHVGLLKEEITWFPEWKSAYDWEAIENGISTCESGGNLKAIYWLGVRPWVSEAKVVSHFHALASYSTTERIDPCDQSLESARISMIKNRGSFRWVRPPSFIRISIHFAIIIRIIKIFMVFVYVQ